MICAQTSIQTQTGCHPSPLPNDSTPPDAMVPTVEIRLDVPADEVNILDAVANLTGARQAPPFGVGKDSADAEQRRVAIAICRTARINPLAADADRS